MKHKNVRVNVGNIGFYAPTEPKPFDLKVGEIIRVGKDFEFWSITRISKYVFCVRNDKGIPNSFQKKEYQYGLLEFKEVG